MTNCKPNELVAGEPHRVAQWNKTHTHTHHLLTGIIHPPIPSIHCPPSSHPQFEGSAVSPKQPIAGGPILICESSRAIKSSEKWHPRLVPPCSDGLEGFVVVGLFSPDTLVHRQCEHGSRDQSAPLNRWMDIHRFRPHIDRLEGMRSRMKRICLMMGTLQPFSRERAQQKCSFREDSLRLRKWSLVRLDAKQRNKR